MRRFRGQNKTFQTDSQRWGTFRDGDADLGADSTQELVSLSTTLSSKA